MSFGQEGDILDSRIANETVTEEAQRLVMGDRGTDYGHPLDDYTRTALMLTALVSHKLKPGEEITCEDAIRFMCAVKLSRDCHEPRRDNMVDVAGYALCRQRATEERQKRGDPKAAPTRAGR